MEIQSSNQSIYLTNSIIHSKDSSSKQDRQCIDTKCQLTTQLTDLSSSETNDPSINKIPILHTRKRGRSRKEHNIESHDESVMIKKGKRENEISNSEHVVEIKKRGRGRPRKIHQCLHLRVLCYVPPLQQLLANKQ